LPRDDLHYPELREEVGIAIAGAVLAVVTRGRDGDRIPFRQDACVEKQVRNHGHKAAE
jgi:hypothetical protein